MAYKLLDEKRNIWGCRLEEIPFSRLRHITDTWGDDPVNSITFFGENDGRIIMNMSHKDFTDNLETFKVFLDASEKTKRIICNEYPENENFMVLQEVVHRREALEIQDLVDFNFTSSKASYSYPNYYFMKLIERKPGRMPLSYMYIYGYIQGKRAERARRKNVRS